MEINGRRMDAEMDLRIRYASEGMTERMVALLDGLQWGSLTLGGLAFDVLPMRVDLDSQYEGDVLKVECRLRPSK